MENFCEQLEFLKNFYKNKKVLITGIHGFQGTYLALLLSTFGAEIFGIGLNEFGSNTLFNEIGDQLKVKEISQIDIRNRQFMVSEVLRIKPEIIFHTAFQSNVSKGLEYPALTIETNINGIVNLLEAVKLSAQKISVVVSSGNYENSDIVAASKFSASKIIESYNEIYFNGENGKRISEIRSKDIFGGGDFSQNSQLARKYFDGEILESVHCENGIHILDLAFLNLLLAANQFSLNSGIVGELKDFENLLEWKPKLVESFELLDWTLNWYSQWREISSEGFKSLKRNSKIFDKTMEQLNLFLEKR